MHKNKTLIKLVVWTRSSLFAFPWHHGARQRPQAPNRATKTVKGTLIRVSIASGGLHVACCIPYLQNQRNFLYLKQRFSLVTSYLIKVAIGPHPEMEVRWECVPIAALRILAHTLSDYVGPVVKVSGLFGNCSLDIIATHFNVLFWHSAGIRYLISQLIQFLCTVCTASCRM